MRTSSAAARWLRQFAWLMAIWVASVLALSIAALLIRGLMQFAGMTA